MIHISLSCNIYLVFNGQGLSYFLWFDQSFQRNVLLILNKKTTKPPCGSPVSCLSSSKTVWSISGWFLEDKAWRSSWIWSFCALPFFLWTKGSKMASFFFEWKNKTNKTHTHTIFIKISTFHDMYWLFHNGRFGIHIPNGRCFIISKERKRGKYNPKKV